MPDGELRKRVERRLAEDLSRQLQGDPALRATYARQADDYDTLALMGAMPESAAGARQAIEMLDAPIGDAQLAALLAGAYRRALQAS